MHAVDSMEMIQKMYAVLQETQSNPAVHLGTWAITIVQKFRKVISVGALSIANVDYIVLEIITF